MKVLLLGSGGQLGWELQRAQPAAVDLVAPERAELDVTDATAIRRVVEDLAPDWIVNAAAYTAVDRAESEPELARAINRDGAAHVAQAAASKGSRLIHVSTDFIFDGALGRPYRPDDAPHPLGVYGASKLAGERAVLEALGERALVLRTAWLYSVHGANFVKTMLRLMAGDEPLRVVDDQVGTPTWAGGLAAAVWRAIDGGIGGVHHWTDAGVASWYDFAVAIREEALVLGLLDRAVPVQPIPSSAFPTPARRPSFSVLDKVQSWPLLGTPPHWRTSLRRMLHEMAHG
ncbi:MAG: dTDP-4-dehydrorhamnose reductase [Chromatiales bacterium]|jgi:dTDP-4-dehydrorhamnose reductase|nr:dTDP-4-dehydrorhamnose reductase [Chromatiales bacterium]MDX9766350.1 dTDP-4-dehydrorhamnose reductase [Ectothiorhodospiraceae bacterium]